MGRGEKAGRGDEGQEKGWRGGERSSAVKDVDR